MALAVHHWEEKTNNLPQAVHSCQHNMKKLSGGVFNVFPKGWGEGGIGDLKRSPCVLVALNVFAWILAPFLLPFLFFGGGLSFCGFRGWMLQALGCSILLFPLVKEMQTLHRDVETCESFDLCFKKCTEKH